MKKNIFKKIVASLATVAMAAGLFTAMPAEEAKAAEEYMVLGTDVGSKWDASAERMTAGADGKYTYTFTATVDQTFEFKIANVAAFGDGNWKTAIGDGSESNFIYKATSTTVVITYDSKLTDRAGVTVTGATNTKAVNASKYYVTGVKELFGEDNEWKPTNIEMTAKDGVYTKSFENVAAGTYAYKILGDGSWNDDYVYGLRAADSNNGVVTVAEDGSTVTFSIDGTTKAVTVKAEVPQAESKPAESKPAESKPAESKPAETKAPETKAPETKAPETTTAKKVDSVTVTVEWKDAPEGDVNIHAWGAASTNYPGQKMTANGDGTYTTTLKLTSEGKISFVVNVGGDANKTKDITDVDTSTGKIVIKISKDAEGKLVGTANAVSTGNVAGGTGSAKPGDSAPIVMMLAVAAVAAGMVVASKKKTICE